MRRLLPILAVAVVAFAATHGPSDGGAARGAVVEASHGQPTHHHAAVVLATSLAFDEDCDLDAPGPLPSGEYAPTRPPRLRDGRDAPQPAVRSPRRDARRAIRRQLPRRAPDEPPLL